MNVIKALTRPCRLALTNKYITRGYCSSTLVGKSCFHQHRYSTMAIQSNLNAAYPKRYCSLSAEPVLLDKTNIIEEQVSPFETFRAKALKKGRVAENEIVSLLKNLDFQGDRQQLIFLLNCCADSIPNVIGEKKVGLASQIWLSFAENSYQIRLQDVIAFLKVHHAAGVCVNSDAWWVTPEVQKFMEDKNVVLLMLECAAECGNTSLCAEIIAKMKTLGFTIGEEELACSILADGRAKNYQAIETTLNTMRILGIRPGNYTYFALLQAALDNSKPISDILSKMQKEQIALDDRQMVKIIYRLAVANNSKLLSSMLQLFPVDGLSHLIRNLVIQLIYEGKHIFACNIFPLLLKDVNAEELKSILAFFPTELVRSNKNADEILEICLTLKSNFPHHNSFLHFAVEESLRDRNKGSLSCELLAHISPVRNHYFWPLLIRSQNIDETVTIVKKMQALGLKPDHDTLTFYIFPNLIQHDSPMSIMKHFQSTCELTITKQLGPLLHTLLNNKQVEEALELCKQVHKRTLDARKLMRPLVHAAHETKNAHSTAYLLALIVDSRKYQDIDVVGLFLSDYCNRCTPADLKDLIGYMAKFQLKLSMISYEILSTKPTVKQIGVQYLDLIASSSYSGANTFSSLPHPSNMNLEELEAHLIELKSKQMNTRGLLRKLLQVHCRQLNVERALQIKKELEADRYEFSPGILSSLLTVYIHIQDVSSATDTFDQITEYPKFFLDEHKLMDYCKLKVQTGSSFGEVVSIIESYCNNLHRHRKTPRNLDVRNCLALVEESKKMYGEDQGQKMSAKLSDLGFI